MYGIYILYFSDIISYFSDNCIIISMHKMFICVLFYIIAFHYILFTFYIIAFSLDAVKRLQEFILFVLKLYYITACESLQRGAPLNVHSFTDADVDIRIVNYTARRNAAAFKVKSLLIHKENRSSDVARVTDSGSR